MWTLEKPTLRGFYWYRKDKTDDAGPRIVFVYRQMNLPWDVVFVGNDTVFTVDELHGEWLGPLEPPA